VVYKGQHLEHGNLVAWNEISIRNIGQKELRRILNEMTLLKTLAHPNLITFYGAWWNKEADKVVFITELMSSGTLREFCSKYPINLRQIKRYCRDILDAISYLHTPITQQQAQQANQQAQQQAASANGGDGATANGGAAADGATPSPPQPASNVPLVQAKPSVIHRDLKCDNIFIQARSIKIGDLGLATTDGRTTLGTPEFMAPEMYESGYGAGVDIYAFGMCVLEMITGRSPFCEFKGIYDIYRRVGSYGLPENARVLQHGWPEAYEFLLRCLTPKAIITPVASESVTLPPGVHPPAPAPTAPTAPAAAAPAKEPVAAVPSPVSTGPAAAAAPSATAAAGAGAAAVALGVMPTTVSPRRRLLLLSLQLHQHLLCLHLLQLPTALLVLGPWQRLLLRYPRLQNHLAQVQQLRQPRQRQPQHLLQARLQPQHLLRLPLPPPQHQLPLFPRCSLCRP
jgi:serine/threonine protein kinase